MKLPSLPAKQPKLADPACQSPPLHRDFYRMLGKRLLDIAVSSVGLLALLPLFAICALLIKLTSAGPVFYTQRRIGRNGCPFDIVKFRSMITRQAYPSPRITSFGDSRVTRFGTLLRISKIDELPQLWNVLKGDMSLVGPRPEIPEFVATYNTEQRRVLTVRPGMTDPASIHYRQEERLVQQSSDMEEFYRTVILPHKLLMNHEYIAKMSLWYDISLILRTLLFLFVPSPDEGRRQA